MMVLKARDIFVNLSVSSSTVSPEVSESAELFNFLDVKSSTLLESLIMSIVLSLFAIITDSMFATCRQLVESMAKVNTRILFCQIGFCLTQLPDLHAYSSKYVTRHQIESRHYQLFPWPVTKIPVGNYTFTPSVNNNVTILNTTRRCCKLFELVRRLFRNHMLDEIFQWIYSAH